MTYRTQSNGTAERMVQSLTQATKRYVSDDDQSEQEEYAERITFAINSAHDRICGDRPCYLIHGWEPRSTSSRNLAASKY